MRLDRRALLALPLLVAGCGLSGRPYVARRDWGFDIRRPSVLPAPARGPVLLVRDLDSGPGMADRGLQTRLADGQVDVAFYDRWAVPPAEGVADALRAWLLASGKFSAVLGPASLATPDLVLEGEVQALYVQRGVAHAMLGIRLLDMHGAAPRIRLQRSLEGSAPVAGKVAGAPGAATGDAAAVATTDAAAEVAGMNAALAQVFGAIEAAA
jgi:ABC-type uncharacterized transport system auxiliary subunit